MTRVRSLTSRLARGHTRIGARLLLFNVLLVFLPIAGLVYLDAYEEHLLDQQERAMVDAGRILAAALSNAPLDEASARRLMSGLARATDGRFRVVSHERRVLADSHAVAPAEPERTTDYGSGDDDPVRASWLYRTGAVLGRTIRRLFANPPSTAVFEPIVVAPDLISAPEVERALTGRYGAATRLSPAQRSVTLYSALPIWQGDAVTGAVLVSQSTWRILQRIYDVRLRMFSVVVLSLVLAVALMVIASLTIVTPVRRLRDDAESLAYRRGRLTRRFRGVDRTDEIGELARALDGLTSRLEAHLRFSERFAADVTHEFRNPLASIRASADLLAEAERREDREQFHRRIERDIGRLEVLLRGVRDVALVDAQLEEEPRSEVDLVEAIRESVANRQTPIRADVPDRPVIVAAATERLAQILGNLIDNAESFSPPGAAIDIALNWAHDAATVTIRDRGPGIANEHLSRVFDRFFCHRPGQPQARQRHTGLGLSIAKAIAESYGGSLRAANHRDGGAVLELTLPALR